MDSNIIKISNKDKHILRDMAKQQLEIAHSPKMEKLRKDWILHGNFDSSSRPMITMELWTFADDIIPDRMRCEGDIARELEWSLHANVVNHLLFDDDTIVKDYIPVTYDSYFIPWGVDVKVEHTLDSSGGHSLGHNFVSVLSDLEEDFHKLGKSKFGIDKSSAQKRVHQLNGLFGDILPAKITGSILYCCPMQNLVHIMSMEDMFMAMYDYPEIFKEVMAMQTRDYLELFDLMEKENYILPTIDECHLGQGSYCFNNKLPREGDNLTTKDIWGYMDSQETSGVSAAMYGEFVAPYYKMISDRFGLFSYGCCEAIDPIWESSVSKWESLTKVSISPWCNERYMGDQLKNKEIVYLRKPTPNLIGVGSVLDEDAVIAHFEETVSAATGTTLEIAQRDVYHINNTPDKVRRYVELIRKCCDKHHK
ncbi:MAG TPA: hypothetical protein VFD57_02010 [Clostridia bacterium]|nr:hypothetical protein [Clostridia bacterium]